MRKTIVHILSITTSVLLSMAGASLAAISCTKTTVPDTDASPEGAITFSGVDTKAAVDTPNDISSFSVWGWYSDDAAGTYAVNVFDAEKVSKIADGSWGYDVLRYWLSGKTYDFYALYPDVAVLMDEIPPAKAAYDSNGTLTVTGFDSTKGHDLMTASRTGMSGGNPQMVDLKFSHELVRLSFKVHAENAIVVSACLYGVNYGGTLKKEKTSEWTELEKAGNAGTTPFRGNDIEFVDGTADLFGEILILPHTDLSEARLDLTFKTSDTGPEKTLTYNLSNTDVSEWTAGKSYGYNVILSGNMDLTVTVSNWVIQDTVVEW